MFDQKGQVRILEAFLSVAVMFSALLLSSTLPSSPDLTKQKSLTDIGIQALIQLDTEGTLGDFIVQRNWTNIKQSLVMSLPIGIVFNLTVFDENYHQISPDAVINSDLIGRQAVSVEYVCSTRSLSVQFFILRLQLAWAQ